MSAPPHDFLAPGAERPTRVRHAVLAGLCSLAFLTYLDRICISRVQGDIERDLGFTALTAEDEAELRRAGQEDDPAAREELSRKRATKRMGPVLTAFLVGYLLFEIPGGWLGDLWGPRRVIFRIVVWWSVFTALTGSVGAIVTWFTPRPEPWMFLWCLLLIRFLFGAGEAGAYPNISRAVSRWFPAGSRASAQGVIWLCSRWGGAFAPYIIAALMHLPGSWGSWQGAFWSLGLAGIVWATFFFLWFRDRPEDSARTNQAERQLIRAAEDAGGSIYDDAPLRLPWRKLFLSPSLLALYMAAACVGFSWYFYIWFLPRYLKEVHDVDYADSGYIQTAPFLVGGLACLCGGRLSDVLVRRTGSKRWGRSLPGVVGFAAAGVCLLLVTQTTRPWQVALLISIACAFQDLAIPCIWSVCVDIGGRYAGTVAGCMNTLNGIGGALSPLVTAQVATEYGWPPVFIAFAASYFIGSLCWLGVNASQRIAGATGAP